MRAPYDAERPYGALQPYQQGNLDGLCGLYAIINAIRLALYPERPLAHRHARTLFRHGVRSLSRTRHLRVTVADGTSPERLRKLLDELIDETRRLTGIRLTSIWLATDEVRNIRVLLARIKQGLRDNEPVILSLEGVREHWTVAVAYTDTRLILFDSNATRWVRLSSLTMSELSDRPHLITTDGAILISRLHPRRLASLSKFISYEEPDPGG